MFLCCVFIFCGGFSSNGYLYLWLPLLGYLLEQYGATFIARNEDRGGARGRV